MTEIMKYEFHDIANLFPLIEGEGYEKFKEDIENGRREPGTIYEGRVLEGRNRYRAHRGRVVIRAIKAFIDGGGPIKDIDLKFAAIGHDWFGDAADSLGYLDGAAKISDEIIELTSELLNEAIALTHPDKHPPERREQATRVTQKLTDLKPFVFPAPQPKPPPPIPQPAPPRNASVNVSSADLKEPSRPAYPSPQCAGDIPLYYCDA
jgi:hypothetical protein